ncbi:MAG: hypothetical protein KGJ96_07175 [Xanthomonadaceae bacterium]|nr:hypothetical protein [Xanthomonadaceae bacterium]
MHRFAVAAVLLAPLAAIASPCRFTAPRHLQLDLTGVRAVQIEVHGHDLHLLGSGDSKGLTLAGKACASDQAALDRLQVTQRREGDQLLLDIGGGNPVSFNLFGSAYARLEVSVQLPAGLPVHLGVGSGDADVRGVRELQGQVGPGDLHVRDIAGRFAVSVGSGDVDATDVGSLDLGAVGSGDVKAAGIKGDARVGSIGSGDVVLRQVGGNVHADTLGSGDFTVSGVAGDLSLGAKGSGDVKQSGVKGKVSLPRDDD